LTSRKNGLVTVYDVSLSDDRLAHVNALPYALPSSLAYANANAAHAVLRHPPSHNQDTVSLLRLFERGNIHSMDMYLSAVGDDESVGATDLRNFEWSKRIHELQKRATNLHPDIGPLGARNVEELNLRAAYESIPCHLARRDGY
jgi:hypothetical protein